MGAFVKAEQSLLSIAVLLCLTIVTPTLGSTETMLATEITTKTLNEGVTTLEHTTVQDETTAGAVATNTPSPSISTTTTDSVTDFSCYECSPGKAQNCSNEITDTCRSTSACYVNVTWIDDWTGMISMGCTQETDECLYQDSTKDCPKNETNCLLCCSDDYCNSDILANLLSTTTTATTTTTTTPIVAPTTAPSPATPEITAQTPEPSTVSSLTPAEESTAPSTPSSVQETTIIPSSASGSSESEGTVAVSSTAVSMETSTPLSTTTGRIERIECYCTENCTENGWTQLCPVGSVCFLHFTSIGESNETMSLGCIPDNGQCHVYNDSSEVACPENATSCLLCCNWQWCNQEFIDILNPATTPAVNSPTPTPTASVPTATVEPPTDSPTPMPSTTETKTPETPTPEPSTTETPTSQSPISDTPTPWSSTTETPTSQPPISDTPTPESSTTETPTSSTPVTETPIPESSTTETPTSSTPVTETPTPDSYTTETATSSTPVTETPTPESSTTETPTSSTPVTETPTPESSTTETPTPGQDITSTPSETFTTPTPTASPSTPTSTTSIGTGTPPTSDLETTFTPSEEDSTTAAPSSPSPSASATSTPVATIIPSTVTPTARNETLKCYQCVNEPSGFCNITASYQGCQNVDDVCRWSVSNNGGSFNSTKGCIKRDECQRLSESNEASCGNYVTVKGECNWCCEDDDKCNFDRGDYSETPPPTTAPAPGHCDMNICLLQFQLLVARASKEPDLFFNEFCRSVPLVFACLANATAACGSCDGGQTEMIEMILANMTAQCPVQCDAEAGFNCTVTLYYDIIESLSYGINCDEIKGIIHEAERCRIRTVGSCDANVRETIDIAFTAIRTEIELICNATQPTFPPLNGTESPKCNISNGLDCIAELGDKILVYFNQNGDISKVCSEVQLHYNCYWEFASECSDGVRYSLEAAWNFTVGMIAEQCTTRICDTTKARTCIVDLMSLIETKKDIQGACRMIPETIDCVVKNTEGCELDEQESLNRTLEYTLDLIGDQCKDNVEVNINETIQICEGDDPAQFSFVFKNAPGAICGSEQDCKLFIDVEIEAGNNPKCRNGNPIRQAVVVRSPGSGLNSSLCSFEVTEENWNKEQNVSIAAKLDFKYDKMQIRRLIVWYRKTVKGITEERRSLANSTLYICDQDKSDSMCSSVNDPHIKTFDGWYYNNFLDGFFILYRHTYLPYEVQIATQRCNSQASCNCAVAVRCGDTVLYIDKCRKKGFVKKWCSGKDNNGNGNGNAYGHDKYKCDNVMKIHLFGHDRITPGMRIFSQNNGKIYLVLLPHGQTVKITIDGKYLSVWITPSPYDIGNTEGLCGNYDGNSTNDLTFRNKTLFRGQGNKFRGQPKDFCKNWAAAITENIYNGVSKNPYVPDLYCECEGNPKNSTVNSKCNSNALVETCDMDLKGVELRPPFEFSDSEVDNDSGKENDDDDKDKDKNKNSRKRRQAEDPMADYDIDATFDPPLISDDNDSLAAATAQCEAFFATIAVAQKCQQGAVANFTTSVAGCVDDLLATNSTEYMMAALEALKAHCTAELALNPVFANSPIAQEIAAVSCPNECNGQGTCNNGTCKCKAGFSGDDCGFNETASLQYVAIYNNLCDITKNNCTSAQLTGTGFMPNTTTCWVQPVKVTENGVEIEGSFEPSVLNFVSPDEGHCQLKKQTSAMVQVTNSGAPSNSTLIVVYDSTCWNCLQIPTASCTRVKNSCVIDNSCYGPGQENQDDKCMICRPEESDSTWTFNSDSESCSSQNIPLIIGLCVGLGAGLFILTFIVIIVVYRLHCADSKRLMTTEEYDTLDRGSVHRSTEFSYDNLFQSTDTDVAGSIRGGSYRCKEPPPEYDGSDATFNETFGM